MENAPAGVQVFAGGRQFVVFRIDVHHHVFHVIDASYQFLADVFADVMSFGYAHRRVLQNDVYVHQRFAAHLPRA